MCLLKFLRGCQLDKNMMTKTAPLFNVTSINDSVNDSITDVTSATMNYSTMANWIAGALSQAAAPYLIQITSV